MPTIQSSDDAKFSNEKGIEQGKMGINVNDNYDPDYRIDQNETGAINRGQKRNIS